MALLIIPTRTDLDNYEMSVELDGATYQFIFAWNYRDQAWYFSIADSDGVPIASGVRIVVDWILLKHISDSRKPPGTLVAIDTAGTGVDPGLTELGDRVQLMYQEAAA